MKSETFYLVSTKNDKSYIEIGVISFDNFWTGPGWNMVNSMLAENNEKTLNTIKILNEQHKQYEISEFIDYIKNSKLNIIR